MTSSRPPQLAVILVAGIGQRLRPLTDDRPKALVRVGQETMLARATRLLIEHGVRELILATGYREQAVREAMRDCAARVTLCPNPDYERTQNSVSLLACAEAVAGRAFYKLDGDLLFHPAVLERLDASAAELAAAVDPGVKLGHEEMKVQLQPGTRWISAFGKHLEPALCWGESIGIERVGAAAAPRLFASLAQAKSEGRTDLYYEDVYSRMIAAGTRAEAIAVGDLGWAEVDTAEDLLAASELVGSGGLGG